MPFTYVIGRRLERAYKRYSKLRNLGLNTSQIQHRAFTICAFISFNLLFWMGVNPTLGWLQPFEQQFIGWIAVITSTILCSLEMKVNDTFQELRKLIRYTDVLERCQNLPKDVVSLLLFKIQQQQRSLITKPLRILEI